MDSNFTYFYKVVLENQRNELIQEIKEKINSMENIKLNEYSIYDHIYLFLSTDLELGDMCELLSDFIDKSSVIQIESSFNQINDKTTVFFARIPEYLTDHQKFNELIDSFLDLFKPTYIIPSILYSVRCRSASDALLLINFIREIDFGENTEIKMLIDSDILKLPIIQVIPQILTDKKINKHGYYPDYFTTYENTNIFVFNSLEEADKFIDEFNGSFFPKQMITIVANHFVDANTYSQLEKYKIRFKISDLFQNQNDDDEEDIDENYAYRECFTTMQEFGKVLSCQIDKKHCVGIFQNEKYAKKMVENKNIKAQFVNDSFFITGIPPNMSLNSLKSVFTEAKIINYMKDLEEYVVESSDEAFRKITSPIFKIYLIDIEEKDNVLNRIKKINFGNFSPFFFENKSSFDEQFINVISNNTIIITGLQNKSSPIDVAVKCQEYGVLKFFLHFKTTKSSAAIATFLKRVDYETSKKNLNQIVFNGTRLIVKEADPKNFTEFRLAKKKSLEHKKPQHNHKDIMGSDNVKNKKPSSQPVKLLPTIENQAAPRSNITVEKPLRNNMPIEFKFFKLDPIPSINPKVKSLTIIPDFGSKKVKKPLEEQKPDFI